MNGATSARANVRRSVATIDSPILAQRAVPTMPRASTRTTPAARAPQVPKVVRACATPMVRRSPVLVARGPSARVRTPAKAMGVRANNAAPLDLTASVALRAASRRAAARVAGGKVVAVAAVVADPA